ncbi:hypothetical protein O1L55_29850 [Streptomyces albulus]|nr:hypothetical protein [Streptomyces noursei]
MSVTNKPTSQDEALEKAFGACLDALYAAAEADTASPALQRALQLRSFLAVAEEQVFVVRETIHRATSGDRDPLELSSEAMYFDAQWLEAALDARDSYIAALDELMRVMPAPAPATHPGKLALSKITTTVPSVPASARAGAVRTRSL